MTQNDQEFQARRCALVTGGSRGIGRATALELARRGFDIAIVYAGNAERAAQVVDELEALGAKAKAYRCDVSDEDQVNACVKQVLQDFGGVWALVNNAGVTADGLLMRMKDDSFDKVINVNLKGTFHMTRALAGPMARQRGGRIVNVSSVVGIMGNAGQVNYAASKAGVIGLTKSVARELARRGVTCNAVAPGFVKTDMTAKLSETVQKKYEEQIPLGYLCDPEEIARAIAFLASDEAGYITGVVLPVDGGMSM